MLNKLLPPQGFSAFPFTLLSAERLGKVSLVMTSIWHAQQERSARHTLIRKLPFLSLTSAQHLLSQKKKKKFSNLQHKAKVHMLSYNCLYIYYFYIRLYFLFMPGLLQMLPQRSPCLESLPLLNPNDTFLWILFF